MCTWVRCGTSTPVKTDPLGVQTSDASSPNKPDSVATPKDPPSLSAVVPGSPKVMTVTSPTYADPKIAAPGPQPIEIAPPPPDAESGDAHRDTATMIPVSAAPEGPAAMPPVPPDTCHKSACTISYDEDEDHLVWGEKRMNDEELNEILEHYNRKIVSQSLDELQPLVLEDAMRFADAYAAMRNTEGGPEALEEIAHECAAIRAKLLEEIDDVDTVSTFDRGEGDEEEVDNFWNEPFFLLVSAAKVYDKFSSWVGSMAKQADANATYKVCFKPIASAAQKAHRPAWVRQGEATIKRGQSLPQQQGRGWGSVVDLVRGSIIVDDWDGVLRCLQIVRGDFDVEILRVRNRFTATADVPQMWGGYRHVALTVRLLGHGHVCEVLIHHRQLYSLRTSESDERFRQFRDALARTQDGATAVETFTQLLSPRVL